MLAAAGLLATPPPSEAAFGQAANIFGKISNTAGAALSRRHLQLCLTVCSCYRCYFGTINLLELGIKSDRDRVTH